MTNKQLRLPGIPGGAEQLMLTDEVSQQLLEAVIREGNPPEVAEWLDTQARPRAAVAWIQHTGTLDGFFAESVQVLDALLAPIDQLMRLALDAKAAGRPLDHPHVKKRHALILTKALAALARFDPLIVESVADDLLANISLPSTGPATVRWLVKYATAYHQHGGVHDVLGLYRQLLRGAGAPK
jgi:hypothetical protein